MKHLLVLLILSCLIGSSRGDALTGDKTNDELMLYIGTYTHHAEGGICGATFNAQTGELGPAQTLVSTPNPSFLAASADGRFLYAVNESGRVAGEDKGGLSAFQIDSATRRLVPLNTVSQSGTLCHLSLDASGKWLLAAAYSAGAVSTWKISGNGHIGSRAAIVQLSGRGPNENRQREPHAHHIVLSPDNARAFAVDLGTDRVMICDFNALTGELVPSVAPIASLAGGAGPRHLALTSNYLYVLSELNNTITTFPNSLTEPRPIQVVSTLPSDFTGGSFAAEIVVSPDSRFLYASNRGHNSIACYAIQIDGQLKLIGFTAVGRNPRHFTFDPTGKWLLVANQSDRSISVFGVDAHGVLSPKSQLDNVPDEPVCLVFGAQDVD